jgi:hypothetical protein
MMEPLLIEHNTCDITCTISSPINSYNSVNYPKMYGYITYRTQYSADPGNDLCISPIQLTE